MDNFYIGDIPFENNSSQYISFSEDGNFIYLFSSPYTMGENETKTVYRIYRNIQGDKFIYDEETSDKNTILSRDIYNVKVSDKWYDRPDCLNILAFSICVFVGTIFLVNIFTSIFKKGGILGGLL